MTGSRTAPAVEPVAPLLTAQELAAIRRPFRGASLLPRRAYHDPAFLAFERERWLREDWLLVAREEDAEASGSFRLLDVQGEPVILVRGRDGVLRAFYNVCRHRGTAVEERECGTAVRFQCPYHAWIYDLDGRLVRAKHTEDLEDFSLETFGLTPIRCETWGGFVFLCFADAATTPPLREWLDDLPGHLERFELAALRRVRRIEYDVAANWKFIAENYSECYHCPPLHPQLNALTPYDVGGDYESEGPWEGGWMELVPGAETMALEGGLRCGRPAIAGATETDERRIYYYVLWPLTFISVHPDYLLVHTLEPLEAGRTIVRCDWLFEPGTIAAPDFDPSAAIEFWDLTNRQDWKVCEMQQTGTRSRSWTAGRYANTEASVHAFDLLCADRYAEVRERYGTGPTGDGSGSADVDGTADGNGAGPVSGGRATLRQGRRTTSGRVS
jgi:Rieske 2Fe-2S family protein